MASLFAAYCQARLPPIADLLAELASTSALAEPWCDNDHTVTLGSSAPDSPPVEAGDLVAATSGCRAGDRSDARAVLQAYQRSGALGLTSLQGECAFVLWDDRAHALLVGCDAVGLHAPAYAWNGRTFLFSSRALSLLRLREERPAWHEVYIAHALSGLWCQRGRETAFRGLRRMMGGEILRISAKGLERLPANGLVFHNRHPNKLEEVVDLLADRLDRAVNPLALEGRTCVALSGGLDSCVVAAGVVRTKPEFDAFSLVAPESSRIEDDAAQALISVFPRMRWHRVPLPADPGRLRDVLPISDDPICAGSAFQVGRAALARAARDLGFRCILDGEGGDEIFDQVWWPGDLIREVALSRALRAILSGSPGKRMVRDFVAAGHGPLANVLFGRAKKRLRERRPWLRAAFWESASFQAACDEAREFGALRNARKRLPDVLAAHGRYKRAQDLLRSSIGIDGTSPLLDRTVVEVVGSLGARIATDPDHTKVLLRHLARRRVPHAIAWRPKAEPLHDWLVRRCVAEESNVTRTVEIIKNSPLLSEMLDPKGVVSAVQVARVCPPRASLPATLVELFALAEWMATVSANYFP